MTNTITATNIYPRGEWILVKPYTEDKETETGLIIPDTEELEQKAQGEICAVGDEPNGLAVRQRVIYGAYAGENLKIREDGKDVEYKLLLAEDIIAVIKS